MLLASTSVLAAPLVLAACGGYTSERGGVLNIALEGNMLAAAALTSVCALATHSAWLGLLAGIASSVLLSLLHWLITQKYRIDHIFSGMAINAIALGGTNFIVQKFHDPSGGAEIPQLPTGFYYGCAAAGPILLALYAQRTRGGLWLAAVGSDPEKARLVGIRPSRVRLLGLIATGVFCGLSGAAIISSAGRFTDGMTAGQGFIALAALILGSWRPIPAAAACIAFAMFEALQIQLQGTALFGAKLPVEVWQSLPYLATVLALAGLLGRNRPPLGLGKP